MTYLLTAVRTYVRSCMKHSYRPVPIYLFYGASLRPISTAVNRSNEKQINRHRTVCCRLDIILTSCATAGMSYHKFNYRLIENTQPYLQRHRIYRYTECSAAKPTVLRYLNRPVMIHGPRTLGTSSLHHSVFPPHTFPPPPICNRGG
jgi:hypothetical protein